MGVRALRKLQIGLEATAGTAVAATTIWRGTGTLEDQREIRRIEEDVGVLQRTNRSATPTLLAGLSMDAVPATFEQLPYILEAGVKQVNTGAADGAGSGLIYAYVMPTTAANTLSTYTIEGGDDQQAEEIEYAHVQSFVIAGEGADLVMMSAEWVGRQVALCTFTTGQSIPTVEEILFGKGSVFIDAAAGMGGSQVSGTILGFELNVANTGIRQKWPADGLGTYFSFIVTTPAEATLQLTFEHDGTGVAEKAAAIAETPRAIRLSFDGTALTTAGTTYTYKTLQIDAWGKWDPFSKIDERDGNDIVTGTLQLAYDETDAKMLEITVVNQLATLP